MKTSNKNLHKKVQKKLVLSKKAKTKPRIQLKIKKIAAKIKVKPKIKATLKLHTKQKTKDKAKQVTLTKKIKTKNSSSTRAVFGPVDVQPYYSKKNENYMNKKQLTHFRTILLTWKEELMKDDNTMHHMKNEASNYPDPVDRASQEEEFSLELRTRDRERKLLKKIDETLMRINDQDYGYCDDCGAEIGIRRLEARPTANQCIECKIISEIREKQTGEGA